LIFLVLLLIAQSPEQRLQELRKKLAEQRKTVQELRTKETGILRSIREIDNEISLTRRLINELKKQEENLSEEITTIQAVMAKIDMKLHEKREILQKRVREIYKYGKLHPLAVVLLSYSFSDAIKRIKYLAMIADRDRRVVQEILYLKKRLEDQSNSLQKKLKDLEEIRKEAEQEEENLKHQKEGKQKFLKDVSSKREKAERLAQEMKRAQRHLEKLIAAIQKTKYKKGEEFFKKKILLWPVEGKIVGRFGLKRDEKYGTATRNNGIDISAPLGTEVKAIAPGKVVYASHFLGYGKMVIVDHGGNYISLYAHLSTISVEVGQEVAKGDLVGLVGDTGSVEEPVLHFEIRRSGKPVNPIKYLGKR